MVETRAQTADDRPFLGLSLSYLPMPRFIKPHSNVSNALGPNTSNTSGSNAAVTTGSNAPDIPNDSNADSGSRNEDGETTASSPMDTTEDTSTTHSGENDDEDEDDDEDPDADSEASSTDSEESGLRRWPPTLEDAKTSARSMRQKLTRLALERKQKTAGTSATAEGEDAAATTTVTASCPLDTFSGVATAGFDFHRSLDSTDGPGMVGVMVEEDSFSASRLNHSTNEHNSDGDKEGGAWREWQLQRRNRTTSLTYDHHRATDLATLGFFAKLPGELRNRIYRLVLIMPTPEPYPFVQERETCALGACVHSRLPFGFPGILSTCRQMRAEALPIFIAENAGFRFDARMVESRCVANFIRALGPSARLIKKIVLELSVYQNLGNLFGGYTGNGRIETHEIVLTCAQRQVLAGDGGLWGPVKSGGFAIEIGKGVRDKAPEQCKKIEMQVMRESYGLGMRGGEGVEEALEAVVGSDWLADVVWKCRK